MRSHPRTGPQARLKIARKFRSDLRRAGISLAEWCRNNRVSYSLTHEVLADRCKGHTGESHVIAVLVGLKKGVVPARPDADPKSGIKP